MFKVIHNDIVIDVLKSVRWIRCLKKSGRIVNTDKSSAHGFYGSDGKTVYIMEGKYCPPDKNLKEVKLIKITETEYNTLYDKILNKVLIHANQIKLREARENKIKNLSQTCNDVIVQGVHILFSDGYYHDFRLTLEDQVNLSLLATMIEKGADQVLYHETNKVVQFYPAQDIRLLIEAADKHRTYHTTYFNLLKHCINNMYNIEEINNITYGDSLEKFNVSEKLVRLLKEDLHG